MAIESLVFEPKRVGENDLFDVDVSGWVPLTLSTETGATPVLEIVEGSGLTIVSTAYSHARKRVQFRTTDGTAGVTYRIKMTLTSVPSGYILVEELELPVEADPA